MYETKVSYSVNTKTVEEFLKQNGALPLGIIEPERPKKLKVSLKGEKDDEV
jgi:hypothetical protein